MFHVYRPGNTKLMMYRQHYLSIVVDMLLPVLSSSHSSYVTCCISSPFLCTELFHTAVLYKYTQFVVLYVVFAVHGTHTPRQQQRGPRVCGVSVTLPYPHLGPSELRRLLPLLQQALALGREEGDGLQ